MADLKKQPLHEQVFQLDELAEVFGMSEWKLRKRVKDLHVLKTGNAHVQGYKLGRVAQALLAAASDKAKPEEKREPTVKELLELERLAQVREEAAVRRRELVPAGRLTDYARKVANGVRSGLESLPANYHKQVPHLRVDELALLRLEIARTADQIARFKFELQPEESDAGTA